MFLFKVQDRFIVTGRGLILVSGFGDKKVSINDRIKIIRPDNSIIESTIKGISFNLNHDILIDGNFTRDDVPAGSEVWLDQE